MKPYIKSENNNSNIELLYLPFFDENNIKKNNTDSQKLKIEKPFREVIDIYLEDSIKDNMKNGQTQRFNEINKENKIICNNNLVNDNKNESKTNNFKKIEKYNSNKT